MATGVNPLLEETTGEQNVM
ncbi:Protein of unknown function [Leuconostoc citreum LBAE E16]|nr:Protein of unknown function [Leuconostoc citreum LBAE C10]CCF26845.1 Protein of unknown function [Leuconostoc citreum LBAE C11]CCF29097.1 Protein of unknown function [Leuconostoc citreum LBAE E16]